MPATHAHALSDAPLPLFTGIEAAGARVLPSYLRDHRQRLRARFLSAGAAAMPDYELLEMLLFGALPRIDVKPLARRLIEAFGDLAGVVAAPEAALRRIDGVGDAVVVALKLAEGVAARMARARVLDRPLISSWDALLAYCHTAMSHRETEQFRVLFLDRKNRLIADEEMGRGTVDHVPVYPREVLKRALELAASALILVHNHPSGDPEPSQADIAMTDQIATAGRVLGIAVHDHLVIGRSRETSFRALGLLTG
jgi:DNA repair protein RadC